MRFADILRDIWNAFLQARSGRPNPILLPMVADALAAVLALQPIEERCAAVAEPLRAELAGFTGTGGARTGIPVYR